MRVATLEMAILVLKQLVGIGHGSGSGASRRGRSSSGSNSGAVCLRDHHLATLEGAREEATLMLRNFYKVWELHLHSLVHSLTLYLSVFLCISFTYTLSHTQSEEIFLDMFEDEWQELHRRPLNVEYLLQDASVLLPPAGTPLTGIDFNKRLPCGEVCVCVLCVYVFIFYLVLLLLPLLLNIVYMYV